MSAAFMATAPAPISRESFFHPRPIQLVQNAHAANELHHAVTDVLCIPTAIATFLSLNDPCIPAEKPIETAAAIRTRSDRSFGNPRGMLGEFETTDLLTSKRTPN